MPPRADRAPASEARGVAVSEKACCSCGDSKPHSEFLPSKFTPDGVTDSCRKCTFARAKRDREEREARKLERQTKKAAREKATRVVDCEEDLQGLWHRKGPRRLCSARPFT